MSGPILYVPAENSASIKLSWSYFSTVSSADSAVRGFAEQQFPVYVCASCVESYLVAGLVNVKDQIIINRDA